MAGSRRAQNTVLANEQLLDAVCCSDLCNLLYDLGIVESAITANDKERSFDTFGDGEEDRGDEGLAIVLLLKDCDLLAQSRCAWPMRNSVSHKLDGRCMLIITSDL
jgi:hypothetical protein